MKEKISEKSHKIYDSNGRTITIAEIGTQDVKVYDSKSKEKNGDKSKIKRYLCSYDNGDTFLISGNINIERLVSRSERLKRLFRRKDRKYTKVVANDLLDFRRVCDCQLQGGYIGEVKNNEVSVDHEIEEFFSIIPSMVPNGINVARGRLDFLIYRVRPQDYNLKEATKTEEKSEPGEHLARGE